MSSDHSRHACRSATNPAPSTISGSPIDRSALPSLHSRLQLLPLPASSAFNSIIFSLSISTLLLLAEATSPMAWPAVALLDPYSLPVGQCVNATIWYKFGHLRTMETKPDLSWRTQMKRSIHTITHFTSLRIPLILRHRQNYFVNAMKTDQMTASAFGLAASASKSRSSSSRTLRIASS